MISQFVSLIIDIVKDQAKDVFEEDNKKEENPVQPIQTKVSKVKCYKLFGVEPKTLSE